MERRLVGAIDGDDVAFALIKDAGTGTDGPRIEEVRRSPTTAFPTFTDALQDYIRAHGLSTESIRFGLAVAGVSRGDVITLPNCRWFVSVSGLRAFLRSDPLILNDFAATAWALPNVGSSQLVRIGSRPVAPPRERGTYLIVGTGSGLGMAILSIGRDGNVVVIESEGGHASFAPQNADEDALLATLRRRFGHVSFERLLSRTGLENLYDALAAEASRPAAAPSPSSRIIAAAISGTDPLAVRAGRLYAGILGAFVGNQVLTAGAWDGVFLVEPMLGEMVQILASGPFRSQLAGKGRMARQLEAVPTAWLDSRSANLAGAAAALAAS
ncbi:glucokinase [Sphingomonas parva]|uniref:Glucokinase n=1 Tax=Sphingomonas parva TaxID=2555898 RepID=A0A4Y8ZQ40_9SPHN|nr:glucokinase [Sphingomonas parva]TFI58130.1 glucokinase [Sphingomonas parva]